MYKTAVYQQSFGGITGIIMQQYTLLLLFTTVPVQVANAVSNCAIENKTTGLCACCYSNYSGPNCSACPACVQNFSNNTCKKQCDGHTMHGEYCNITCSSTCSQQKCWRENGYCFKCKDGNYGKLCLKSCFCLGGPCNRETGTCIRVDYCEHCETKRCYKDGKDGTRVCHGKCEDGYYGIDCGKHCSTCKRCDQVTGSCLPDLKTSTNGPASGNVSHPHLSYLHPRLQAFEVVLITAAVVVAISVAVMAFIKLIKLRKVQRVLAWMWRKSRCFKLDDNGSSNKNAASNRQRESYHIRRSVPASQDEEERRLCLVGDDQPSEIHLRAQSVQLPKCHSEEIVIVSMDKSNDESSKCQPSSSEVKQI